jgi:hypothetical protein
MSEPEIPPLDQAARDLLARAKGTDPAPAPADARARVETRVRAAVGLGRSDDERRAATATIASHEEMFPRSGARGQGTAGGRQRVWRAAFWMGVAAAPALVALGVHMRARIGPAKEHDRTAISAVPCGGAGSLDTDPHNCGRCGHDCRGGACEEGVCQPFVIAQGHHPGIIAVDSSSVYWPDGSDTLGRIMKAPKAGGEPVVIASSQRRPWSVTVDAAYAYWVTNSDEPPKYGGVFKVPLEGGEVITLVPSGEAFADDIAVDEHGVYWDDYGAYPQSGRDLLACAEGAAIRKAGLDGSNPTTLAASDAGVCTPLLFSVNASGVYWPSRSRGAVQHVGLDGRGVAELATSGDPVAVAVDSSYVYWVNWQDGSVQRAPLGGGKAVTLASSGKDAGPNTGVGAVDLAVDEVNVYWARQGPPWGAGGAIMSAPVAGLGGEEGAVLAASPNPVNLTLDAACVYWADGSDGKIRAVAKP